MGLTTCYTHDAEVQLEVQLIKHTFLESGLTLLLLAWLRLSLLRLTGTGRFELRLRGSGSGSRLRHGAVMVRPVAVLACEGASP
jgi:hypothetical protein